MKRLTKSQYELVAKILEVHTSEVMQQGIELRGKRGKANLQDLIAEFADTFQEQDTEFNRMEFYKQSGALKPEMY